MNIAKRKQERSIVDLKHIIVLVHSLRNNVTLCASVTNPIVGKHTLMRSHLHKLSNNSQHLRTTSTTTPVRSNDNSSNGHQAVSYEIKFHSVEYYMSKNALLLELVLLPYIAPGMGYLTLSQRKKQL